MTDPEQISSEEKTAALTRLINQKYYETQRLQARVNDLISSNSWRITLPAREVRRWVQSPKSQLKRYRDYFLSFMRPKLVMQRHKEIKLFPSGTNEINLVISATPEITIIIPVFGQIDYTLRCLRSIAENPPVVSYEIIVIDDCSPDDSRIQLKKIKGLRLLRHKKNQGFIRACNAGAAKAKGLYLHFLNNDTQVQCGWLDELRRTFDNLSGTGFVGSKLVYPDGRLQEAGAIIWQDGSAWNYGRLDDAQLPHYNYAREVDYCSGASIMVPAALFRELGGFDEHYLPAYCEDADLALKIRHKGMRVIYQPLSVVVHYEGVTSGTDVTQGAKGYQVANLKKLFTRWCKELASYQPNGLDTDQAKDRGVKRRVLVVDSCTPTPDQDAGSVIMFNILVLLRDMGFQVTFIPEDNFSYLPDYTDSLQRIGIEMLYVNTHYSATDHIIQLGSRYDLALLARPTVGSKYLPLIREHSPNIKVIYFPVDLHFLRLGREAGLYNDVRKLKLAEQMKQTELSLICSADSALVLSEAEIALLRELVPSALVHTLPLFMSIRGASEGFRARRDIVFVGGFQHSPNVDAIHYFVAEIMPIIRAENLGLRLHVVGSNPPQSVHQLACADVEIVGYVKDLDSLLDTMRLSIAPLRYGAGVKGKVVGAISAGLPVIASSIAAEGMGLVDREQILIADTAKSFAEAIIELYTSEDLWNKLSKNGLNFAEQHWGRDVVLTTMSKIISDLGLAGARC